MRRVSSKPSEGRYPVSRTNSFDAGSHAINVCRQTNPGEYEGVCLNPKDIPPDDLDDEILSRMIKEAGVFYKMGGRTLKEHLTDSSLSV
jgi:hypothetical protein